MLEPAKLAPGQTVVDYGCGPGGLAVELARRVAPDGRVHGVDLNEAFLERAAARARREGVEALVSWHRLDGRGWPCLAAILRSSNLPPPLVNAGEFGPAPEALPSG